jgi:transcriptional regulator with XRE-family HTH domain
VCKLRYASSRLPWANLSGDRDIDLHKGSSLTISTSPLVERRRLRAELKQARLEAGLTQEAVADQMDWSLSKLIRIETGAVGISTNDLTALLRLYNVKDPKRVRALVAQAKESRKQAWWSKYRAVMPQTYFQYIEFETAAAIIRAYHSLAVPGLLQTQEYATAVTQRNRFNPDPKTVKSLVEVRMKRQQLLLDRPSTPLLFFVLDEAVIQRLAGDKDLRRAQIEKLIQMAARPGVTIEVLPFSAGIHRGLMEDFNILEFGTNDSDVLYFDSARLQSFIRDDADEIALYRELFEEMSSLSLGPEGTRDYLIEVAGTVRLRRTAQSPIICKFHRGGKNARRASSRQYMAN